MISLLSRRIRAGVSSRWAQRLASRQLTVLFFLLTALSVLAVIQLGLAATPLMVAPFGLLLLNLGAAIVALPRFRRDLPLLTFHLALLLLMVLLIIARLTYQQATTTVIRGESFSGNLLNNDYGLLRGGEIYDLQFTNLDFTEYYPEGSRFQHTRNRVRWQDGAGQLRVSEIHDDQPLVIDGYRIYTTSIRGYAPLFHWQGRNGVETLGRVQLNNAVDNETPPVNEWQLPDGTPVWAMLDLSDENPASFAPRNPRRDRIDLEADTLPHRLVLRVGEVRHELVLGGKLELDNGVLTYLKLDPWMGYFIVYDPTQSWLIATVAVGVLSLLWFYTRQIFRRSRWDSD